MMADMLLRLAIHRITGLRPQEKLSLEEIVDTDRFFLSLTPGLLSQVVGRTVRSMESPDVLIRQAEQDLRFVAARSIRTLCLRDEHYPPALGEIYDPPYLLFVRGALPQTELPVLSIVGTREPTAGAARAAGALAAQAAGAGLPVVSGLARGIDRAAHEGALGSGVTGAVLACGIDAVCPSGHRDLARRILDRGGFLLSEYPPGVPPAKYQFPARNRIISGLARGVVIVQAPARSGALITADYALEQGRDLFVHSAGLDGPIGAGSADLAADGAIIVSDATGILEEWGIAWQAADRAPAEAISRAGTAAIAAAGAGAEAGASASREAGRTRADGVLAYLERRGRP